MLTVGSLFSGIGGLDLGFERAGFKIVWQIENDPFCQSVLKKHWPEVLRFCNVKEVDPAEVPPVDIVVGGPPCQPFSSAGRRAGKKDPRNLWPEMLRFISVLRPTWIVFENVPGIINIYLYEIATDLEGEGYKSAALVVPACAVGAPHYRPRVILVSHLVSKGCKNDQRVRASTSPSWRTFFDSSNCQNGRCGHWAPEPGVVRVVYGVPARLVKPRVAALGNAVVPQVAEWVARCILAAAETATETTSV